MKGKKIFVGLSGGVDSAVSAALLQQARVHITGVFIKGWYPPSMPCTWADDRRDAMRVAARLGIPFLTLDANAEYKKSVIDYLLAEYAIGRTPNPDIMCNRDVKFGAFYRFAMEHGADAIATGHYAQIRDTHLMRSVDDEKDQSYFLWAVQKEALEKTVFPVGDLSKQQTRELAAQFNLPVAHKRDSQGICFLGSISVEEFLRQELNVEPGEAFNEKGEVVGIHSGAVLHTVGERVALAEAKPGPWYVVTKNIQSNELIVMHADSVGNVQSHAQHQTSIKLTHTNWLETLPTNTILYGQYRYHGPRIKGTLNESRNEFNLSEPLTEPIARGQSLALYHNEICVGGGIIS